MVSVNPPIEVSQALAAARLIGLAKENGDVRPIAVGECLRGLCACCISLQEKASIAAILAPVQYGVATSGGGGGLEQVVHQIQVGLESHDNWCLFKCDISNAFNSISRAAIFRETCQHLPCILPFTKLLYGQPSPLIYRGNNSSTVLSSQQGVHQGDPLGPFYFCVAINACVQQFQDNHRDIVVSAYFDDINLMGIPHSVGKALPDLVSGLEQCGLQINQRKCELFHPDAEDEEWAEGMKRQTDGVIVLGAALGSEDWVKNHYASLSYQSDCLINSILSMESKQCAFLLLKHCANSRIAHITRLSPPDHTKEATLIHDTLMEESLSKLLGVSHFTEMARKQVHLKSHSGGLGITSMFDLF